MPCPTAHNSGACVTVHHASQCQSSISSASQACIAAKPRRQQRSLCQPGATVANTTSFFKSTTSPSVCIYGTCKRMTQLSSAAHSQCPLDTVAAQKPVVAASGTRKRCHGDRTSDILSLAAFTAMCIRHEHIQAQQAYHQQVPCMIFMQHFGCLIRAGCSRALPRVQHVLLN